MICAIFVPTIVSTKKYSVNLNSLINTCCADAHAALRLCCSHKSKAETRNMNINLRVIK